MASRHNQQVAAAEAGRVFPVVPLLVGALKRDVEHGAFVGVLPPNAGADEAVAERVDGFVSSVSSDLIFHILSFSLAPITGAFVSSLAYLRNNAPVVVQAGAGSD